MMDQPTQELPPELAERLHRLAAAQMSESRPWPRVEKAVRRSQRRRLAGMSAVAAACVLIIGVTFSGALGLSSDRSRLAPPAGPQMSATPTVSATVGPLPASGYAGPVGGSLAGDQNWLTQVRARAIELAVDQAPNTDTLRFLERVGTENKVQVLWTSDLDGFRYAYVVYPIEGSGSKGTYVQQLLSGPAGASAGQLNITADSDPGVIKRGSSKIIFLATHYPAKQYPDLVLVLAPPTVTSAELESSLKFDVDGDSRGVWRPLPREGGAVWVGRLTPGEGYLSDVSLEGASHGEDIVRSPHNLPQPDELAAKVAPAGSNRAAIRAAGAGFEGLLSLEEQAVFATSRPFSKTGTLAAAVFRTPEGVALVGFAELDLKYKATSSQRIQRGGGAASQPLGDLDTLMYGQEAIQGNSAGFYLLTPVGATSARIGNVTVPVVNRLARFDRSVGAPRPFRVEALNAQGKVIATLQD
jgi:hypothetical protein